MNFTTYGLDISKRVFQLYWVTHESGEIHNRKFGKKELLEFLAQREAGLVAIEACCSAHWWWHKLMALGHGSKTYPYRVCPIPFYKATRLIRRMPKQSEQRYGNRVCAR